MKRMMKMRTLLSKRFNIIVDSVFAIDESPDENVGEKASRFLEEILEFSRLK